MTTIARLAQNSFFSFSADLVSRLAGTLLFIVISRQLGASEAGIYALGMALMFIFSRVAYFGLDQLLTREVTRDTSQAGRYWSNFLVVRVLLSVIAIGILWLLLDRWLVYSPHTSRVVLILGLLVLPENVSELCQALFMAYERMEYLTYVALAAATAQLGGGWLALATGLGIEGVAMVTLGVSVLGMWLNIAIVLTRFVRPRWYIDVDFCRQQLAIAFPFLFIGIFFILDSQLDLVLLSRFRNETDVAIYRAGTTFMSALALLPEAYRTAIFPLMSRYYGTAEARLRQLYLRSFKYLLAAGIGVAAGTTLVADQLVDLVFKASFRATVPVLQVLVWSQAIFFLTILNARLLIVSNNQKIAAFFVLGSLCVNLGANLLMIPPWGAMGAAIARVVSMAVFFALGFVFVQTQVCRTNILPLLPRPLVAGAIMILVLHGIRSLGLALLVPLGATIYLGVLVATGTFNREDRALLVQLVGHRWPFASRLS